MNQLAPRQQWVDLARQGDATAASKLLAAFHPVLRARAESRMEPPLRARLEPEDILQQTYLEVVRRLDGFDGCDPQTFLNWALTILDHKLIDARRALHRQKRDPARETPPAAPSRAESCFNLLQQLYADAPTPSRIVRREEAVGALLTCISRLSDEHQRLITLRFLDDRPVADVATTLGKSEEAVVALTRRALQALRRSMDQLGEFTRLQ